MSFLPEGVAHLRCGSWLLPGTNSDVRLLRRGALKMVASDSWEKPGLEARTRG
jgi:hypothetical protein